MDTEHSVVMLFDKNRLVVQTAWTRVLEKESSDQTHQVLRIFHSPQLNELPNFNLTTQWSFDPDLTGCFYGYLIRKFGQFLFGKIKWCIDLLSKCFFSVESKQLAEEYHATKRICRSNKFKVIGAEYHFDAIGRYCDLDNLNESEKEMLAKKVCFSLFLR